MSQREQQRVTRYYDRTIDRYDALHGCGQDLEHMAALSAWWSYIRPHAELSSLLDIGCGTGRSLAWFAEKAPGLRLAGIDPSVAMCERASQRVPEARILVGSGDALPFAEEEFDLVVATGILHHVPDPPAVIAEMFRVSKSFILISDHNDFAMGGAGIRRIRMSLRALGLLGTYSYLKQGFSRQRFSPEDGWHYPYSLLSDFSSISDRASEILVVPTLIRGSPRTDDFMTRQSHIAIFCRK